MIVLLIVYKLLVHLYGLIVNLPIGISSNQWYRSDNVYTLLLGKSQDYNISQLIKLAEHRSVSCDTAHV